MDYNFEHQMYLSKSKFWYSKNCLHFLKHAVLLGLNEADTFKSNSIHDREHNNTQHNDIQHNDTHNRDFLRHSE